MTTKHLKMLESEENMKDKSKKYFNAIENALAGPAGYSSRRQQTSQKNIAFQAYFLGLAGPAGFEPANAGTKTQCLTAWRRSNLQVF